MADQLPNHDETGVNDHFVFTDEQRELRTVLRDFCAEHSAETDVRRFMEATPPFDPTTWARLGGELGVLGLGVPEELGGAGGGLVEVAILLEELGAALLCGPVLGTLGLAIPALVAAPESAVRAEVLGELVEGSRAAAFAVPERAGRFMPGEAPLSAAGAGAALSVSGTLDLVVDGGVADTLVVAAHGPEGPVLVVVEAAAEGVERTPLTTMDQTRSQARIVLSAAPAHLLAAGAVAVAVAERALQVGAVLLAVEQVGGAQRLLDMSVAHARTRLQFGRRIGSFQAVKHRLADMYVELEHARSAAYHAVWALADGSDDPALAASIAQATCSAAYTRIASDAVQVHGGIGFTWEHPAHLYLKRAFTDAALLGTAEEHRARVAEAVLDGVTPERALAVAGG